MKCSICKTKLNGANIGYAKKDKGFKVLECKRCHAKKKEKQENLFDRRLHEDWKADGYPRYVKVKNTGMDLNGIKN